MILPVELRNSVASALKNEEQQSLIERMLVQHLERFPIVVEREQRKPSVVQTPKINLRLKDAQPLPAEELEDDPAFDVSTTAGHRIQTADGEFWFDGDALMCRCPDCSAPMTARIWIGLADCWRCQSSIELSDSQLQSARALMSQQNSVPVAEPKLDVVAPRQEAPRPKLPRVVAPEPLTDAREQELERLTQRSLLASLVRRGFTITPAWFVSFLLHLIAILILAVIVLGGGDDPISDVINLSTFLNSAEEQGGDIRFENPLDQLQDELAMASDAELGDEEVRAIILQANQDARELIVDPLPTAPLPDLDSVRKNITTRRGPSMSFAARDPRVRSEIVKREGGTTLTEAAVARGLRWLASVQNQDGSWSLKKFDKHGRSGNRGDALGTSLALLPFLGAGQTHEFGKYKQTVAKGLAWLIANQADNGDLRAGYRDQAGIYAHGQASIVLCEALAMTGDEQFRDPAQKAINFIEAWQHKNGGWRYRPRQSGDTSVLGWQVMALQSARAPLTGLKVDSATLEMADYFLDNVASERGLGRMPVGSLYCYQKRRDPTPAMTAEAILCRMYLGWKKDDPRLMAAVKWLVRNHLPSVDEMNLYYWYYGTQALHHYGGPEWETWNNEMRGLLIGSQDRRGRHPGSWDPEMFEWGSSGGRIYTTALAVCTLEVYYRHLPIFKQLELEE